MALKILVKIPKKWGIYRLPKKLAVRPIFSLTGLRSTGQSTANGHKYGRWGIPVDRPVDRPDTESKALWSGRPSHCLPRRAQTCARRSTDRSTDVHSPVHVWPSNWAGRPGGQPGQRALRSVNLRSTGRSIGLLQRSEIRPLAVDR